MRRNRFALLLLPLAACGGDASAPAAVVRDSAGITIVENPPADSAALTWWSLDPQPIADVGMLDGPEAQTLFRVVDAVRLSDGSFAVANSGTAQVRWYDGTGTWLRTAGGEGDGPGEYRRMGDLILLRGDSLAVVDGSARRVTVLSPAGELVRDIPDAARRVTRVARLADGRWVGTLSNSLRAESLESGMMRPDQVWVTIAEDSAAAPDTIAVIPATESYLNLNQRSGQIVSIEITTAVPYARATSVAVVDDGLLVATQDAPEILRYGLDGAVERIVRTGATMDPVTEEMVEAWVDRRVEAAPPERQQGMREGLLNMPAGAVVPPYGSIVTDRAGNLWVEDYDGMTDAPHWTVYDASGERVARIALPADFTPYDIGEDWILGRELDDLEIEHVRLYRLRREG